MCCAGLPWSSSWLRWTTDITHWAASDCRHNGLRWTAGIIQWAALNCRNKPVVCVGLPWSAVDCLHHPVVCVGRVCDGLPSTAVNCRGLPLAVVTADWVIPAWRIYLLIRTSGVLCMSDEMNVRKKRSFRRTAFGKLFGKSLFITVINYKKVPHTTIIAGVDRRQNPVVGDILRRPVNLHHIACHFIPKNAGRAFAFL